MAALTALAIGSLVVGAVGTGMSVYNQHTQANNAKALGSYNANLTDQTSAYNARIIEEEAEYNAKLAEQTADYNAKSITTAADYNYLLADQQAELADMTGRENIRRMRMDGKKVMSTQQARFAKAGVVGETGTPLEVMAETAGLIELNVLDEKRKADAEASATRNRSSMERYMAYKDAAATRYFGAQKAWSTRYFGSQQAYATRYFGGQQATAQRMYGDSSAAGYRAAATGTLLSGAASTMGGIASAGQSGVLAPVGIKPVG
jgi:hypothetical protein